MNRQAWTKEISGILVAILFLALGFLAAWSMHAMQITNMQALQQMTEHNLEAILLIGKDNKVVSVIEREQVLSKLMLGMVS